MIIPKYWSEEKKTKQLACIFYIILSYFYLTGLVSANNQNMPDLNKDILKHQNILTNIHSHLNKHCIEELLVDYADYQLGKRIQNCIEEIGQCNINCEL